MLDPELSGKWWSQKQHSCIYPPSNTENKERELTPQSIKISLKHFYQMHGKSNKYGTSKKEKRGKSLKLPQRQKLRCEDNHIFILFFFFKTDNLTIIAETIGKILS